MPRAIDTPLFPAPNEPPAPGAPLPARRSSTAPRGGGAAQAAPVGSAREAELRAVLAEARWFIRTWSWPGPDRRALVERIDRALEGQQVKR